TYLLSSALTAARPPSPPIPTRRSSDLPAAVLEQELWAYDSTARLARGEVAQDPDRVRPRVRVRVRDHDEGRARRREPGHGPAARSEEHTSELQSRVDHVCRLLLEEKKI